MVSPQLVGPERLGHVVVRAQPERPDLVGGIVARAQDQERCVGVLANLAQDIEAVGPGQQKIQDHQRDVVEVARVEQAPLGPPHHLEALEPQPGDDLLAEADVVFDQQDQLAHCSDDSTAVPSGPRLARKSQDIDRMLGP